MAVTMAMSPGLKVAGGCAVLAGGTALRTGVGSRVAHGAMGLGASVAVGADEGVAGPIWYEVANAEGDWVGFADPVAEHAASAATSRPDQPNTWGLARTSAQERRG